jgi:hypothetical protein
MYCFRNYTVELFKSGGTRQKEFENALVASGAALPLPHRSEWAHSYPAKRFWFFAVRDPSGSPACGFAVELSGSRALPGHLLLRVERFGPAANDDAREAGLQALGQQARSHWRVLRVNVEIFSRDAEVQGKVRRVLQDLGFRQIGPPRSYEKTSVVELTRSEDDIFASLHPTARRHIRSVQKKDMQVRAIASAAYADRMGALLQETLARTGGEFERYDWATAIDFSRQYPKLSRIVGLFRTDVSTPQSLLAFAWGCGHGDHVQYGVAASTRQTDIRVPLGYALAWDLINWAKSTGATWFDFGGITCDNDGRQDPLRGISDFKRYFSKRVIKVGEEWVLEPNPIRAELASRLGSGMRWIQNKLR